MAEPPEIISFSFIIKVWIEEIASKGHPARWRGQITVVPSGERRYVQDLAGISAFIESYLEPLGVPPRRLCRLLRQLDRWTRAVQAKFSRQVGIREDE